jgi:hypothetical protein
VLRFCQMFCRTLAVTFALMMITGCVGLVAPASAMGATTRADAPDATSTAVGPCYDVQIIGLRGSGEPQRDTEHNMGSLVGPIADSIARQAPEDGTTVSFYGLPYEAVGLREVGLGILIDDSNAYFDSKRQGMSMLHDYLGKIVAACPYMKLVVSGYSQGAHAAGDQLATESSSITDHVAAFVMFGGTFDPSNPGFLGRRALSDFSSWNRRIFSFCNRDDPACNYVHPFSDVNHEQS